MTLGNSGGEEEDFAVRFREIRVITVNLDSPLMIELSVTVGY
jgi:hypothetical protein